MEMIIILCLITGLGVLISVKSFDYDFIGQVISIISIVFLLIHIFFISISSYEYNVFVVKREAFVYTLENARKNNNNFEIATITKDVSELNKSLAVLKYNNKTFFLKDYIDDRIEKLEAIE